MIAFEEQKMFKLEAKLWQLFEATENPSYSRQLIDLYARRSRLLGLDAPQKMAVNLDPNRLVAESFSEALGQDISDIDPAELFAAALDKPK